ncbi:MAG: hypothetical protein K5683_03975 [Prevotella sp.]|nr:hypothetical protein [Prevotella sp.]
MSQITTEYLEQLEKEARSQLSARMVANLEAQATHELNTEQTLQINSQINRLPMTNFVGYLLYGIINKQNISQFTNMSSDRRDIAMAFINRANGIMPPGQEPEPKLAEEPLPEGNEPKEIPSGGMSISEMPSVKGANPIQEMPPVNAQANTIHSDVCLLGTPLVTKAFWGFISTTQKQERDIQSFNVQVLTTENTASIISDNKHAMLTMYDLDTNALAQLNSEHKKQVFFILDATTDSVNYNQIVSQTDEAGNIRNYSIHKTVSQAALIKQLFQLLSSPDGRQFLRGTTTLSLVFTKAGKLGAPGQRDHECLRRFKMMHHDDINPLIQLCHESGINASTNGQPMLFTFDSGLSFGNAVSSPSDTEKLVEMLKGNTAIIEN